MKRFVNWASLLVVCWSLSAAGEDVRHAAAAIDDDQKIQQEAARKLRPLLETQLQWIRDICQPTTEQWTALCAHGESLLRNVADSYTFRASRIEWMACNGKVKEHTVRNDPRSAFRGGLAPYLRTHFSAGQYADFQTKSAERKARERQIIQANVLAALDERLYLSEEQRDALRSALADNWKDTWCPTLEFSLQTATSVPDIPDGVICPCLTTKQVDVWKQIPKVNVSKYYLRGQFTHAALEILGAEAAE